LWIIDCLLADAAAVFTVAPRVDHAALLGDAELILQPGIERRLADEGDRRQRRARGR
jgi:hypothetical protein